MQVFMSLSTVKSERRRKSRNRPPRLVYVELPNGNGGMMRDLSEEGFAVRAMIPLAAGGSTYFAFSLGESIRIEGEGKIVWNEENGRVAGVQFTQIASTAREQILNWLSGPQETPEREEMAGKPVVPPASVLEQLREEIRSIPRGENRQGPLLICRLRLHRRWLPRHGRSAQHPLRWKAQFLSKT